MLHSVCISGKITKCIVINNFYLFKIFASDIIYSFLFIITHGNPVLSSDNRINFKSFCGRKIHIFNFFKILTFYFFKCLFYIIP